MICLIQRAQHGSVTVNGAKIGAIEYGMVVLVGFEPTDSATQIAKMTHKLLNYRLFADANDKMNLNIQQINGGILLVPQFTLAADTKSGLRPSFSSSAAPDQAQNLFNDFVAALKAHYPFVETGEFGADMQVSLTNDGPVTFWLQI